MYYLKNCCIDNTSLNCSVNKEKAQKAKKIEKSINLKSTVKDEFYISKMVISFENVNIYNISQNKDENENNNLNEFGKNYQESEENNNNNEKPILSLINKDDFLNIQKSEKKNINNYFMKSSKIDDFNVNKDNNSNVLYKTN